MFAFRKRQQGMTLIELAIGVIILGVLLVIVGPSIRMAFTFMEAAKKDENRISNQRLAGALMSYARNNNAGRLPNPYTGAGIRYGLFNPADTSTAGLNLAYELRSTGVPVSQINNDGAAISNVRVYQRVGGRVYQVPFYLTTGKVVTLYYDVGAVVQTMCPFANACNSTGVPGDSGRLSATNLHTWVEGGDDYGAIIISTLPEQKDMLRMTSGRINRLSDRFSSEFNARLRLSAANSTQNFFPAPNNAGAPVLSGRNPVTNMGCHDGWYRLNAVNVNVLAQMGLDPAEFGVTAWGGAVEYCRDYDPSAVNGTTANTPPHYAALRMNSYLSNALVPTGTSADVIITF